MPCTLALPCFSGGFDRLRDMANEWPELGLQEFGEGKGVSANLSNALRLPRQVSDALPFLRTSQDKIRELSELPFIHHPTLYFHVEAFDPPWEMILTFPPELVSLAGTAGIALSLSLAPETGAACLEDELQL
jgi:hypothetical protein